MLFKERQNEDKEKMLDVRKDKTKYHLVKKSLCIIIAYIIVVVMHI